MTFQRFTVWVLMMIIVFSMPLGQSYVVAQETEGDDYSISGSISGDGRFVAFESLASNLIPNDTNNRVDIFVHDRQTGQTTRVSVSSTGEQADLDSWYPNISADGRFVTFYSYASNLVTDNTNGWSHVFVHDRQTRQTTRVSVSSTGDLANQDNRFPSISADGRFVAFNSFASNLVPNDTNNTWDAFVHDQQTGQTMRVSVGSTGIQGNSSSGTDGTMTNFSADGRFVAFNSFASNLVPNDTNGARDVFVHDLQAGQTWRASVNSAGIQGNTGSESTSISSDGRFVAFVSDATNLVSNDTNSTTDVFVHDQQTAQTVRISVSSTGVQGNESSWSYSISGDGRFVVFESDASNLVSNDTNDNSDIFVHDLQMGVTSRISLNSSDVQGNDTSYNSSISTDGRFVIFDSDASNLVSNDENGVSDVFVRDRQTGQTTRVSIPSTAPPSSTLSIEHMEVTQVIQDDTNSVPLIANKPTYVRVYVNCGECTNSQPATGILRAYDASTGDELPNSPRNPDNGSILAVPATTSWQSQRENLNSSLNFTLPSVWLTGEVRLEAEVEGDVYEETVPFQNVQSIDVTYYPINYNGQLPDLNRIKKGVGEQFAVQVYPLANINYQPGTADVTWNSNVYCRNFICQINQLRLAFKLNRLDKFSSANYFIFGWLPETGQPVGWAAPPSLGGKAAFATADGALDIPNRRIVTSSTSLEGQRWFAHELGHLLGRSHANTPSINTDIYCMGTFGIFSYLNAKRGDWPYIIPNIDDIGLGDGVWSSQFTMALHLPSANYDYMSYCGSLWHHNVWTSQHNYKKLYERLEIQPSSQALVRALSSPQSYLDISGIVFDNDEVDLQPIFIIEKTEGPDNPTGNDYCVEAQNSSQVAINSQCFDLDFFVSDTEDIGVSAFSILLPFDNETARIVLKKQSETLAIQEVSSNSPQVTVIYPNGGENWNSDETQTISWLGTDADGDSLTYAITYSINGVDWLPLDVNITDTELAVDTNTLPGSTNAIIRVIASDGINTSSDESDALFTVATKGPQASISTPEDNANVEQDVPIWFQGSAYDLEDGNLGDDALVWRSDLDGELGTGDAILTSLSLGQHQITLSATDSDGNISSSEINVTVQQTVPQPPDTKPNLLSPLHESLTNDTTLMFSWDAIDDAGAYRIEVDNNPDFLTPEVATDTGSLTYEATLIDDGMYYWRVHGLNTEGAGPWSEVYSFTIDTGPPQVPSLIAPEDNQTDENSTPTFEWSSVVDAIEYEIQLDTANPPEHIAASSTGLSYQPTNPLLISTYYWQVRAIDAAGNPSDWSEIRNITILSSANDAPVPNYFTTSTPVLTWNRVTDAAEYEVQVDSSSNFADPLDFATAVTSDTLFVTTTSLSDGLYYWRVRAQYANDSYSNWSVVDSFTILTP